MPGLTRHPGVFAINYNYFIFHLNSRILTGQASSG